MRLNNIIQIGNNMKKIRVESELTQQDVANILNIPRSTYANYEKNTREPSEEVIKSFCEYFNITVIELIDKTEITTLGEKIKNIRKSKKITQQELGELIGVSEQAISQYERGLRSINLETLIKISNALQIPISELRCCETPIVKLSLENISTEDLIEELKRRGDRYENL